MLLTACTVGQNYVRPEADTPGSYKEMEGWKKAQPSDDVIKGKWWEVFNDPELNSLEEQVNISNQNVAAAEAQFRQALAAGGLPTTSDCRSPTSSLGSKPS